MQVMLRKDATAASALMLYRKKPERMERAPPAFLAAPSAEASNEVCTSSCAAAPTTS